MPGKDDKNRMRAQAASSGNAQSGGNFSVTRHLGRPSPALASTVTANRARASAAFAKDHIESRGRETLFEAPREVLELRHKENQMAAAAKKIQARLRGGHERERILRAPLHEDKREAAKSFAKSYKSAETAKSHMLSEPVSSGREAMRASSTNLMADIREVGSLGVKPSEVKTFSGIKDRQRQKQGVEALEQKRAQHGLSEDETLQLSAASSKLRMRSEVSKLIDKDASGKEQGFNRLASAIYFQTKTAGEMGLKHAIHTTTNPASLGFIQRDGIDPTKSQESGRGDRGFYGAGDRETSLEEIGAHGFKPHDEITHAIDPRAKVRDFTHPVDRPIISNRSADDAERDGRPNRGNFVKKDTLGAEAEFAALPSMRQRSGINTIKYTAGMSGYKSQAVTKTYNAEEQAQQQVKLGGHKETFGPHQKDETTATRRDVHAHRQRTAHRVLFAEIHDQAQLMRSGRPRAAAVASEHEVRPKK